MSVITSDGAVEYYGSIALVQCHSTVLRQHLEVHIGAEAQWWGTGLAVEPRYIEPLVSALRDEGFVIDF